MFYCPTSLEDPGSQDNHRGAPSSPTLPWLSGSLTHRSHAYLPSNSWSPHKTPQTSLTILRRGIPVFVQLERTTGSHGAQDAITDVSQVLSTGRSTEQGHNLSQSPPGLGGFVEWIKCLWQGPCPSQCVHSSHCLRNCVPASDQTWAKAAIHCSHIIRLSSVGQTGPTFPISSQPHTRLSVIGNCHHLFLLRFWQPPRRIVHRYRPNWSQVPFVQIAVFWQTIHQELLFQSRKAVCSCQERHFGKASVAFSQEGQFYQACGGGRAAYRGLEVCWGWKCMDGSRKIW